MEEERVTDIGSGGARGARRWAVDGALVAVAGLSPLMAMMGGSLVPPAGTAAGVPASLAPTQGYWRPPSVGACIEMVFGY